MHQGGLHMYSLESNENEKDLFWDLIQSDNAVLFLGQNYQTVFFGSEIFRNAIDNELCHKAAKSNSYSDLWKELCKINADKSDNSRRATVSDEQLIAMQRISSQLPNSESLCRVLNAGWASIVTSSVDDAIVKRGGLRVFYPIYDSNTRVPGLGNKRKLHISYLFGCICEKDSVNTSAGYNPIASDNAHNMYMRVKKDAISYSGALVIDGWDPETDWFNEEDLLASFDYNMPFPRIYIFSATDSIIERLRNSRRLHDLIEEGAVYYSPCSFFETFSDRLSDIELIDEFPDEDEDVITVDIFADHRNKSFDIPRKIFRTQDTEHIHIITKNDRDKQPLDKLGVQGITISFLANDRNSFPIWQGYSQNCYFNRDLYYNDNNSEDENTLKGAVLSALKSKNLHSAKNMIVLQGPSNSGKSILLGKLALDISKNYPVLFINGVLSSDGTESTKTYKKFVDFVTNFISKPCAQKRANSGRSLIIWDNNQLSTNLQEYYELRRELSESNAVLVVSAYKVGESKKIKRNKNKVVFLDLSNILNRDTELKSLSKMLSSNLGEEYAHAITQISTPQKKSQENPVYMKDSNTQLLYILRRLFQAESRETRPIYLQSGIRTETEVEINESAISSFLQNRISKAINDIDNEYMIERMGLLSVFKQITSADNIKEQWYKEVEKCAPILNDIVALAGQFGIRLPLTLIQNVLADLCPGIRYYMPDVEELLSASSMIEYPFPIDEYGQKLIGYRSIEDALAYLESHYTRRLKNAPIAPIEECDCREDREIFLLMKIIEHGDISEYWGSDFARAQIVKSLLDQFTPNSYMGNSFAKAYQFRYDDLANCIMQFGGQLNPEFALTSAYLRREKRVSSMLEAIMQRNNISKEDKSILDRAASDLEHAIELETNNGSQLTGSLMRLYIEWCTNRNYTLNREKPSEDDLLVYNQIHSYFSKALNIYLRRNDNPMKPTSMLDVFLNVFEYYAFAMEALYKVQTDPLSAKPEKLEEYETELQYALNTVVSKLLVNISDFPSENFVEKLQTLYSLAHKSIATLEKRAATKGITAFTLLRARYMWCDSMFNEKDSLDTFNSDTINKDLFLLSDYSETEGVNYDIAVAADRVYKFFKSPRYVTILTSNKPKNDIELSCLEMLIKATWIKTTGNMPFTRDQKVRLTKDNWNELHTYCDKYCSIGIARAKYSFAYFLEGIYKWLFTPNMPNKFDNNMSSSDKYFYIIKEYCYRPKELPRTDSVFVLCNPDTLHPIVFESNVVAKGKYRYEASIINAVDANDITDMPYITSRSRIYCAQSLHHELISYSGVNKMKITIRFNLEGPLAGPSRG